jgi:hypothetical protein
MVARNVLLKRKRERERFEDAQDFYFLIVVEICEGSIKAFLPDKVAVNVDVA